MIVFAEDSLKFDHNLFLQEMYENACAHKDMDKFLDTSQSGYLQLPEFLREKSPRSSPMNSPRLSRERLPLTQDLFQQDAEKNGEDEIEDDDKESECSLEGSQDADEEVSDSSEEQTPTLSRPTMFPNDRRESLKNGNDSLPRQDTLTPSDSTDFMMNLSCEPSPTSPSAQALSIMAFDEDFDSDENPSNPTQFAPVPEKNNVVKTERTKAKNTFKGVGGTISKAFRKDDRSRKLMPNNVTKTKMADQGPSSSDESCGDILDGKSKKKGGKSLWSKAKTTTKQKSK